MNTISRLHFSKKEKFVLATFLLAIILFIFNSIDQSRLLFNERFGVGFGLAILTDIILFLTVRKDVRNTFFYPLLILPFAYSFSFTILYLLFPARFLSRSIISIVYGFGLYSLFLTHNIFAVSTIRTINLLRSARVISFIITILSFSIIILFYLVEIVSLYPILMFSMPVLVFCVGFILLFQLLWFYILDTHVTKELILFSLFNAFCLAEVSTILSIWPISPVIYALSLTGIFYAFSGLSHSWFEKKLFKGVLWEYVWVGFLSIFILIIFSKWGI